MQAPAGLKSFLRERAWLKVELQAVEAADAGRILARALAGGARPVRMTPEAIEATVKLARGRADRLRQLAELARIVAEVEGAEAINEEQLSALADEFLA